MFNNNRENFQYQGGDLVYIISPLTSQLRTNSRKISVKYIGPVVIYKIIDPHNYLLKMLDGIMLRGIFKHERLKPAVNQNNLGKHPKVGRVKTTDEYRCEIKLIFLFIDTVLHRLTLIVLLCQTTVSSRYFSYP